MEAPDATVVSLQRFVDIGWRVEINVLTAKPPDTVAPSVPSNAPAPSSGARPSPVITSGDLASSTGSSSGSDSSRHRVTLVTGTAVTSATAQLSILSNLWRFGTDLDFSDTAASITPDAPAMADFLATDAGKNLLGQALAPLRAATGVELSPQVAPGGALSASYVQRLNLPAFQVQDLLLAV